MNVKLNKEQTNNRIVQNAPNLKALSQGGPLFLGHTEQTVLFQPKILVCLYLLSLLFILVLELSKVDQVIKNNQGTKKNITLSMALKSC